MLAPRVQSEAAVVSFTHEGSDASGSARPAARPQKAEPQKTRLQRAESPPPKQHDADLDEVNRLLSMPSMEKVSKNASRTDTMITGSRALP